MTKQETLELISYGESQTLEFKKTTGELKEICQAACGMLNAAGGRILIGVSDAKELIGQEIAEGTLRKIQVEFQKIEPSYNPEITLVDSAKNKKIIWETEISKSKTIDDLDHPEIIITLKEAILRGRLVDPKTRDIMSVLKGLRLIRERKLTNAAVALFIKEDRALPEYTQLHLKMARFKGNDKNEFIDSKMFYGNAFAIYKQAQSFLIQNLPIAGKFIPGVFERLDEPLYPMSALREAIANTICHREYEQGGGNVSIAIYDNRLEISSSGGLHFGLTAEDLFKEHESKSWNPLISSVFYKRGLIETWGRGTLIIKEQIEQAGLVSPSYTITNNSVILVFSPERQVHSGSVSVNLDARQQYIANIFFHNPNQTYSLKDLHTLVSQKIDINKRSFKAELQNLKNLKLISTEGRGSWC